MRKKVKGQLVFEFLVAVLIFFGILFYVLNYLGSSVSSYREAYASESMEGLSYKIGELLAMNKGNWSNGIPAVVGLAEGWPVLNWSKIQWLNEYCAPANPANYQDLKRKLGIDDREGFSVVVDEIRPGGSINNLAKCPSGSVPEIRQAQSTRYGILDTTRNVVVIKTFVW